MIKMKFKIVKDTRYIVGVRERFYRLKPLLYPLLKIFFWTEAMETKIFYVYDTKVIEYCKVHYYPNNTELMCIGLTGRYMESGHKHFGLPSFYPVCGD